ncbi:MAG: Stp1/IreP family PP2C-type Ser/Thr phosphatase [Deltaproteobacteria bacterium]|nr:Stp1/IreP family PP2C-type Ser/Thr phosphatase [Deltaproteobacteria bacterium]
MAERELRDAVTTSGARVRVLAAGRTDTGRVREHNEDHVLLAPELGVYIVADGMGGHSTGDVASALACASMRNFFEATRGEALLPANEDEDILDQDPLRLAGSVRKANADVFEISQSHVTHKGMGSTVVALFVSGDMVHIAHVGDSRCYRIRGGEMEQLTRDHSLVNEALALRPNLTPEQVARLPKNVVTRALGMKDTVNVDVLSQRAVPGDLLLLCSDGLTGMVDDSTILDVIGLTDHLDETCELLVTLANDAGGKDNISVLLVRFEAADEQPAPATQWRGIALGDLALGHRVLSDADDVMVAAEESFIEDPIAQLEGLLPQQDLERLRKGETVELTTPRCSSCGTALFEGNAFCTECGTPVAR